MRFLDPAIQLSNWKHIRLFINEELSRLKAQLHSRPANTESQERKIRWKGTEKEIIYLFALLKQKEFLADPDYLWSQMERHFLNREDRPFKAKQLASIFQRLRDDSPGRFKEIDDNIRRG